MFKQALVICLMLLIGWGAHASYAELSLITNDDKTPFSDMSESGTEHPSPSNWVKENQIRVYSQDIVLDIQNGIFTSYADTNSMDPLLDETANGIEIRPIKSKLKVGDIISYRSTLMDAVIIHRIISIGEDKQGTYYIVKGDNNSERDPERVRFEQIEGVVVALIY